MEVPGVRVLRGPDWKDKDVDGGECHVGTVTQMLRNHMVLVVWDMGQESICCAGQDGKFDLRILDTAQVGVHHQDIKCTECGETDFYGPLWRCQNCEVCNLCSVCYCGDKHSMSHPFLRIDAPGAKGLPVPNRKTSVKNRALGIYPGAKVTRGSDWQWEDQDGGQGSEGEVLGYKNVVADSSRNLVKIKWPNGTENSYRLGFQGYVDLKCVEEELGPCYYRDHLPVLDTANVSLSADSTQASIDLSRGQNPPSSPAEAVAAEPLETSVKDSTILNKTTVDDDNGKTKDSGIDVDGNNEKSNSETSSSLSVESEEKKVDEEQEAVDVAEEESFVAGQKVAIKVSENTLLEMQETLGVCNEDLTQVIGYTGEVVEMTQDGTVSVRFGSTNFTFSPSALAKVFAIKEGTTVQVREDEEEVKILNARVGWKEAMSAIIGKAGKVLKIDSDGDLLVTFGRQHYMFAPAACIPAPDMKSGSVKGEQQSKITAQALPNDEKRDSSEAVDEAQKRETEELYRKLREKIQTEPAYVATDNVHPGSLFSAVNKGEHAKVWALCLANRSMNTAAPFGQNTQLSTSFTASEVGKGFQPKNLFGAPKAGTDSTGSSALSSSGGFNGFGATSPPAQSVFGQNVTTTTASAGFSFGAASSTGTGGFSFGQAAGGFGTSSATTTTTTAPTLGFGNTMSFGHKQTAPAFPFGQTQPSSATASPFSFGQASSTSATTVTSPFGGLASTNTSTTAATAGFSFGAPSIATTAPSGGFNFSAAATSPAATPGVFSFGGAVGPGASAFGQAKSSQPQQPALFGGSSSTGSGFSFGMAQPSAVPAFGAPTQTATPAFGASQPQQPVPSFGGFGSNPPASTGFSFGSATPAKPSPIFGSSTPQAAPAFGGTAAAASPVFGATQPSSGTPVFGASANQNTSAVSSTTPGAGFNFTAGQKSFSFGAPQNPAASPSGGGFQFGQPSAGSGGFDFSASFTGAPQFNFGAGGGAGTGNMFTPCAGSTAPKPRAAANRARRRGAKK